jgi:hypothetical protein
VGILGAFVVIALLFSSFLVLVFWRKPASMRNHQALIHPAPPPKHQRVTVGTLDGQRARPLNGVFQVRSELAPTDPVDPNGRVTRCKIYDIELFAGRRYLVELDSLQFDGVVRVELFGQQMARDGVWGRRNAAVFYRPVQTQVHRVVVTSVDPANGEFTLTVREDHLPKPAPK